MGTLSNRAHKKALVYLKKLGKSEFKLLIDSVML